MSDLNPLNLEAGQMVGGYTLLSRLGGGAMGSVWRVKDDGGTTYAMKILRDSLNEEGEDEEADDGAETDERIRHNPHLNARERLRREAMALQHVRHPGVCSIVDMELDDSLAFIVTELIEGRNLRDDVTTNGRYTGQDLERLARKLIDAVQAVHAQGIIHRDIKPTNVMVSAAGPVLVDFGIAMEEGESHVTRTGLVMGTPGFIAPEIIDGAESNEATDWWSLASVLAFAATGQPVFGVKPMMAVLEREAAGNANLAGLPPHTLAAFRAALSPDIAKRCTPGQLLDSIMADSSNPAAGIAGGAGGGDGIFGNNGQTPESGANLPFDAAAPTAKASAASNPRTLWSSADDGTNNVDASIGGNSTSGGGTDDTTERQDGHGDESGDGEATEGDGEATRVLSPSSASTQTIGTATGQITEQTTAIGAANAPDMEGTQLIGAPATSDYNAPGGTRVMPVTQDATETLPPAAQDLEQNTPLDYAAAEAPDPALEASMLAEGHRSKLMDRAPLAICLLAVPLAVLAASHPLLAFIALAATIWLVATLGLSENAQLAREARHLEHRRSDSALRVASLPWHILKALIIAIPRSLLAAFIGLLLPTVITLVAGSPHTGFYLTAGSQALVVPLPTGMVRSWQGLIFGVCMALAWLSPTLGAHPSLLRLGAGCLPGPVRHASGHHMAIFTGCCAVLALAAAAVLMTTGSITWLPLAVA